MITADILRMLADRAHDMDVYPDVRFPPSVYYRFLQALSDYMKPATCVELGTCGGGGSLHMTICRQNLVISVDHNNDYPEQIQYILSTYSNFLFWQCDSIQAALRYAIEPRVAGRRVDVLFIDTVHTEECTMAEFDAWRPLLSDRAIVLLDDLFRIGMLEAWDRIPGHRLRMDDLHIGGSPSDGGFGAIWNPDGWM